MGYELAPFIPTVVGMLTLVVRGADKAPARELNTVMHHDMHHRFPTRHFSLYFTHLDRMFGTLHPKYDTEVQQFFESSAGSCAGGTDGVKDAQCSSPTSEASSDTASGSAVLKDTNEDAPSMQQQQQQVVGAVTRRKSQRLPKV